MQVNFPLVKQIIMAYYCDYTADYVRCFPLDDRREKLTTGCQTEINNYNNFPADARTRVIARAVRQMDDTEQSSAIGKLVSTLEKLAEENEIDNLITLVDEATIALRSSCPKEFKSSSQNKALDGITISTFDFIDFVVEGGVSSTLSLKYAMPTAIIENIDRIYEGTEYLLYRGLNPKGLTDEQLRLKENPDLLDAARCGFLSLDCADELIDFAETIYRLRYIAIKKLWKEKDDQCKRLITEGFNNALLIARDRLLEGYNEDGKLRSKQEAGAEYKSQVDELAKIYLREPRLSEISLDKKIDFGHSFKRNMLLIAQALPDEESVTSQIEASIKEMCPEFNLGEKTGLYHTITRVFNLPSEMKFLIPQEKEQGEEDV